MTELPESRSKLHSSCLLCVLHGCFSVQSVFLAQKCRVAAPATSCTPLPWGLPLFSKATLSALLLQQKAREGSWNMAGGALVGPCTAAVYASGPCSPPTDLLLLVTVTVLEEPVSWFNRAGKKEATAPLPLSPHLTSFSSPRRLGTTVSSGCVIPALWDMAWDVRLFVLTSSLLSVFLWKHLFACLQKLLLDPNCKVRLQRAISVSAPCGAAYFFTHTLQHLQFEDISSRHFWSSNCSSHSLFTQAFF